MDKLIQPIIDLFSQLPDVYKLALLLLLILSFILMSVWKVLGIRREKKLKKQLRRKQLDLKKTEEQRDDLQKRFDDLLNIDEHVWRREVKIVIKFTEMATRKTRFVTFGNFKGGVCKTTLITNLGGYLAQTGKRVLLVDLDWQGTMSDLLLEEVQLKQYRERNWTVERLLSDTATVQDLLDRCFATRVPNCDALISFESLSEFEFAQQAKFFADDQKEIRFAFRKLFHVPEITEQYDYVLFDCPPRLSTACINALTCSDYIVIPTSLSQSDIDAVPRTLTWLKRLSHIIPGEFLGAVIARCAMRKNQLTKNEELQYANLKQIIAKHITGSSHIFEAKIPDKSLIYQSSSQKELAVFSSEGKSLFEPVALEFERRIHR